MTNHKSARQQLENEHIERLRELSAPLVNSFASPTTAASADVEASLSAADGGLRRRRSPSSVSADASRAALIQLDLYLTDRSRSLRRCWTDLVQLQLVGGQPEAPVVDWNLAVSLGHSLPGSNFALCTQLAANEDQLGTLRLVLDTVATTFAAGLEDPFAVLPTARFPALATAILRECRKRADCDEATFKAATQRAADRIRARTIHALRQHSDALPAWLQWCVDAPMEPTTWPASVNAAALAQTGRQLLSCVLEPARFAVPMDCAVDALVFTEQRELAISDILPFLPREAKLAWCEYLPQQVDGIAPIGWDQVVSQMTLGAKISISEETLAVFAHPVPWTMVAAILRDGSAQHLVELAFEDPGRWFGFDAPDDGEVGHHLVRLLMLDRSWSSTWCRRMVAADIDEDELAYIESTDVMGLWAEFGSPDRVRQELPNPTASSSYSHGLNDVIAEAYGDVWSPRDPFSTRGKNPTK